MEKTLYKYIELPTDAAVNRAAEEMRHREFMERDQWNLDAWWNLNGGGYAAWGSPIRFAPLVVLEANGYCS